MEDTNVSAKPHNDEGTDDSDDEDLAFATLDLTGVNFDCVDEDIIKKDDNPANEGISEKETLIIELEKCILFDNAHYDNNYKNSINQIFEVHENVIDSKQEKSLLELSHLICTGQFTDVLRSKVALSIFGDRELSSNKSNGKEEDGTSFVKFIRDKVATYCQSSSVACLEVEIVGVAALNLFLQLNYTGPSLEQESIEDINPHVILRDWIKQSSEKVQRGNKNRSDNYTTETKEKFFRNIEY